MITALVVYWLLSSTVIYFKTTDTVHKDIALNLLFSASFGWIVLPATIIYNALIKMGLL